jgi:hypothetical protein
MPQSLGPIDVYCDAPPYPIIQACNRIGLHRPEDVRWCRMSHLMSKHDGRGESIGHHGWRVLLGTGKSGPMGCDCGQPLPGLEKCTFTFITGREVSYMMGQCTRCHAVFWEDA